MEEFIKPSFVEHIFCHSIKRFYVILTEKFAEYVSKVLRNSVERIGTRAYG